MKISLEGLNDRLEWHKKIAKIFKDKLVEKFRYDKWKRMNENEQNLRGLWNTIKHITYTETEDQKEEVWKILKT
jgi:hypothetical protein